MPPWCGKLCPWRATGTLGLSPGVWNVWPRLAASGWRLAGVWPSGRLAVWGTSGSRLGTSRASGL
eukprot:2512671-Prymnesium_polylepis.1